MTTDDAVERPYRCRGCGLWFAEAELISTSGKDGPKDAHDISGSVQDYCGPVYLPEPQEGDLCTCGAKFERGSWWGSVTNTHWPHYSPMRTGRRDCEHEAFAATVDVHRLSRSAEDDTVVGYTADIHVSCRDCGEPFEFIGLPMGALPSAPAASVTGLEARMPIRPTTAPRTFGLGLPGFTIRREEG